MDNLIIEPTSTTLAVNFDAATGVLTLQGKSTIEYPFDFYETLIAWVDQYAANPRPVTNFEVALEYCNTSSSKCLLNLLKKVALVKEQGGELNIKWIYDEEDEDIFDAGSDFSRLVKIPFQFIQK